MKYSAYFLLSWGAALLLGGCAQGGHQLAYIDSDAAKNAAFSAADVTADAVTEQRVILSNQGDVDCYEVSFAVGDTLYRYQVEARTGVILAGGASTRGEEGASPHLKREESKGENDRAATYITPQEALAKVLIHSNLTADQVTVGKNSLDRSDGRAHYNIVFFSGKGCEHDYEVDAYTGQVLSAVQAEGQSSQPDHVQDSQGRSGSSKGGVTSDEAKRIALAKVPGASLRHLREFEVSYEDGRLQYEGKILCNQTEYQFEIDGYSGGIRTWETNGWGS